MNTSPTLFAIFETSQESGYHETAVITEKELKKIIAHEWQHVDDDSDMSLAERMENEENFCELLEDFVLHQQEAVYQGCSSGIVSIVRLSDGTVWGKRGTILLT